MRGEDASLKHQMALCSGTPPHAWGRLAPGSVTPSERDTPTCVGKTQTYPPELAVECSVMVGALPRNPLKKIGKVFDAVTVHPDPLGEALAVAPGSVTPSELIAFDVLQPPLALAAPDDAAKDVAASSWDLS